MKNILPALLLSTILLSACDGETEETVEETVNTTEEVVEEEVVEEEPEEVVEEEESGDEDTQYINDELVEYLDMNQGWALGTIDENANPTDDGEPNDEYANWMYVRSIVFDGDNSIDVQVTEDFRLLPEEEKDSLAASMQGYTSSYTGERPRIYIYNGENAVGHSEVFDANEYTWY